MKKISKFIINYVPGFLAGCIVCGVVGVNATSSFVLDSTEVEYNNTLSGAAATTVKQALDYLNNKAAALLQAQNGNNNNGVYAVGDHITYDGAGYRVIEASSADKDYVTLLKDEPLTVAEINDVVEQDGNMNDLVVVSYGEMVGNDVDYGAVSFDTDIYDNSIVKRIVDRWAYFVFSNYDALVEVDNYYARLITEGELASMNCTYEYISCNEWLSKDFYYWVMPTGDYGGSIPAVEDDASATLQLYNMEETLTIRPVINLSKDYLDN